MSMPLSLNRSWTLIKQSVNGWVDDGASSMGAALAYYTIFSLAPLLVIVIAIAGMVFGDEAARGALFRELAWLVGNNGAEAIEAMLKSSRDPDRAIFSVIIGAVTLFIGATTVFAELQTDLDRIWKSGELSPSGLWGFVRTRLLSFGMVLGIGFLLIVSLVMSAAVAGLAELLGGWFRDAEGLLQGLNFAVSFVVVTALFALIYKILPNVKIAWSDVWIGAGVTSLLFAIGKFLIGLYIGKSAVSSSFGAAGALVVLIVWVYYSAQIFLLGAEFTYVYAHEHGSLTDSTITPESKSLAVSRHG
ncbi:MAG TPA: YihY/virulence factor BrkB family protein [Burkholderiales bacterium]|nr:YihY/virulence factor BrkB family protein [Burkholderiales bacterium]